MLFQGSTPDALLDWQARFRSVLQSLLGLQPERAEPALPFENETDCGS